METEVIPPVVEETIEQTTAPEQTTEQVETPPETIDTPEEMEAGASTDETPSWEPTYSYKVRDEEKEFDEWARPFIKDEDTYKNFQDLYTRGDGLEIAKAERDEYKNKFTTLDKSLSKINEFVQANDAESFIRSLGLPEKMFMDYALEKLKYLELSDEERARVDAEKNQTMQLRDLQTQNEFLAQQQQNLVRAQRTQELETGLSSPEVSSLANEYDARVGTPGAFKKVVIERGIFHSQVNNTDISAQQAINEAVSLLGLQTTGTQTHPQTGVGTPPAQSNQPKVVHRQKPVIPNLQGTGTSPLKKRPRSIEDIKKIQAQRLAQQQGS